MARVGITYNGTSIQTATYVTEEIEHESMDSKRVDIQRLGKDDGGKVVSETYDPKVIRIRGTIFGSSQNNLESNLDDFKFLLNQQRKDLDIDYAAGTRRYRVYTSRINYIRRHYNVTFAEFEAEFVVAHPPFGMSIDTSTITQAINTITTSTIESTYCFSGTRRPLPIIQMTVNACVNFTKVSFKNTTTGDVIIVRRTFAAAEVLEIDTENYTVTVDGTAVDYDGVFPEFARSCNSFRTGIHANSANVTIKYIYYSLFL